MGEVRYPRPLGTGHGHLPAPYQPEIQTAGADSWLIAETMYKAHIPVNQHHFICVYFVCKKPLLMWFATLSGCFISTNCECHMIFSFGYKELCTCTC